MDFLKALALSRIPNPDKRFLEFDGYAISYNPITDTGPETALIVPRTKNKAMEFGSHKYFILLGDHVEAYSKCTCLADANDYFRNNAHLKSPWSD